MMENLAEIYDTAFFAEWGPGHAKYIHSAMLIVDELHKQLQPQRIVDLGSGCGVYSHLFKQKGVDVVAIDGVVPPSEHAYPVSTELRDLTVPFNNVWGKFDFALCLEVAEHIPEPLSNDFLDNILRFSDRLILSAAQPNQGGHHHVNEQPKRYWVAKLAAKNYAYNRRETGRLLTQLTASRPPYMWMIEQISVYDKVLSVSRSKDRLPFSVPLSKTP